MNNKAVESTDDEGKETEKESSLEDEGSTEESDKVPVEWSNLPTKKQCSSFDLSARFIE